MTEQAGRATLQLFGTPHVAGLSSERGSELLARPKTLALLAYLAVSQPKGPHRRDELLRLFWPDTDASHGRNSLRQAMHALRISLPAGSVVTRGNQEVGLADSRLHVDVSAFESALDSAHEAAGLPHYVGDFMAGFTLEQQPELEAWIQSERDRLRRRAVRAAIVQARSSERDGNADDAACWGRWALQRAPFDEALLRDVMEMLTRLGDRAGATMAFSAFAARMSAELDLPVSDETMRVSRGIRLETGPMAMPASATPSPFVPPRAVSDEARLLSLKARGFASQRSPATIGKAIELYERAIRMAPDYAEAHAGLASAHCQAPVYSAMLGTDAWPRVRTHATRALRLDPRLGEAHTFLAHATLCSEYDWVTAEQGYRRALELDSVSYVSRQLYALYWLVSKGRTDDALAILDRARDEMPDVPGISAFCGMACVFGRRYDRALVEMNYLLEAHPGFVQAYWIRGMAQEASLDFDGAVASFEQGAAMTANSALFVAQLARACAQRGERERARRLLHTVDERGEPGGPGVYYGAEVLAALGDTDAALDRLYAAYRQRNPFMVFAGVKFGLDPLRETRRFRDLLVRLGLPTARMAIA